jgi:hypothetical protein
MDSMRSSMKRLGFLLTLALLPLAAFGCDDDSICDAADSPEVPALEGETLVLSYDAKCPFYRVRGVVPLNNDSRLVIEPGVTLVFERDAELQVHGSSELIAVGTPELPITFTGAVKERGFHRGVAFVSARSTDNELRHVIIEYGGAAGAYGEPANLYLYESSLSMSNSRLQESAALGFSFYYSTLRDFTVNNVTDNATGAGRINARDVSDLQPGNLYVGNDEDILFVNRLTLTEDTTWPWLGLTYHVSGDVVVQSQLQIEEGVRARFPAGSVLEIHSGGSLTIDGASDVPVQIWGLDETPGSWRGLRFVDSDSVVSAINHLDLRHGGADGEPCLSVERSSVGILNSEIRSCAGDGFYFGREADITVFTDNSITDNAGAAGRVHVDQLNAITSANSYAGNDVEGLHVEGTSTATLIWSGIGVPYLVAALTLGSDVDLLPGVEVQFAVDGVLTVVDGGLLTAIGTAESPIRLVGQEPSAGFWQGVYLDYDFSSTQTNALSFVELRHGGAGDGDVQTEPANLRVVHGRCDVSDSTVGDSLGWGIYVDESTSGHVTTTNVTFENNALGDVGS